MRVVGVDGCKGGWFVVELTGGSVSDSRVHSTFADVIGRDAEVIGVDIPLGEPIDIAHGGRKTDQAARDFLVHHKNAVFNAPPWAALQLDEHDVANSEAQRLTGKGLSAQSFGLRHKIRDAMPSWRSDRRVYEVHPEVSFQELAGGPIPATKKTDEGNRARVTALARVGIELPSKQLFRGLAAADDIADAGAAAWSAARIARGEGRSLPDPPERDVDGRPVAIWY